MKRYEKVILVIKFPKDVFLESYVADIGESIFEDETPDILF